MSFIYHYELFYDLWTNFEMWYVLDLNIYDYELFFLFILFLMYVYVYKIFLLHNSYESSSDLLFPFQSSCDPQVWQHWTQLLHSLM